MPKGIPNKRHTGEFKQRVVEYMRKHKLSCVEAAKIFETGHKNVALWERIYLTYGTEGLYLERWDVVESASRANRQSRQK